MLQNFGYSQFGLIISHYLILQDLPKLNRCTELLSMNEELKQARKAFEVDEEKLASTEWFKASQIHFVIDRNFFDKALEL